MRSKCELCKRLEIETTEHNIVLKTRHKKNLDFNILFFVNKHKIATPAYYPQEQAKPPEAGSQ